MVVVDVVEVVLVVVIDPESGHIALFSGSVGGKRVLGLKLWQLPLTLSENMLPYEENPDMSPEEKAVLSFFSSCAF